MRSILATFLLVVLVVGPAGSFGSAQAEEESEPVVVLSITEPLPLEDFLKVVSMYADAPLVWDAGDRGLMMNLISGRDLVAPRSRFFEFIRALLFSYGVVLVPIGPPGFEVYRVEAIEQAHLVLHPEWIEPSEADWDTLARQETRYVAALLPAGDLRQLEDAGKALARLSSPWACCSVTPVPEAHGVLVVDFAPAVVRIHRLLETRRAPEPVPPTRSEIVPLRHARAGEVALALEHSFAANGASDLRITPDLRANQVLVRGPAAEVEEVLETVTSLDVPVATAGAAVWTHVVRLAHVRAEGVVAAIEALLPAYGDEWPSTFQTHVRIVAHPETNAVLISATPHDFEQVQALLTKLDLPE